MNFDGSLDWIDKIWGDCGLANHFKDKFTEAYNKSGSMGVVNAFYGELDDENRRKLIVWVMENYNNEIPLYAF